jgi:hypothetical protein
LLSANHGMRDSIGAFALVFLLFLLFVPAISTAELRKQAQGEPVRPS